MGSISYTDQDRAAAYLFSKANYDIRMIQAMYKKKPHLISKLEFSIRDATQKDYYLPKTLIGRAKVTHVKMTESCCKALSCNPMKENQSCRVGDAASWYHVGEAGFDVQCQPSCFNTAATQVYDTTNTRTPDTPLLNWHAGSCRIVNSQIDNWLTKPRYRADTAYETRLNDLPIGFTRIKSDNPFGSGYTYKNDSAYCGFYELEYDAKTDTCVTSLLEKILGAVVGSSLLQNLKGGIKAAVNGGDTLKIPSFVPALPKTHLPTVEEWQNDIDKTFVVPKLVDYTTVSSQPRREKRDASTLVIGDNDNEAENLNNERLVLDEKHAHKIRYSSYAQSVFKIDDQKAGDGEENPQPDTDHPISSAEKVWEGFFEYITSPEGSLSLGVDFGPQALKKLKSLILKLSEKLGPLMAKLLAKIPGSVGLKVIQTAIQNVALKVVSTALFRIGAQLTLFLARMLAAAASVVGWLLMAAFVFDLMFTFWDPFGYNNLFPPKLPADTMYNGELALRQAFSSSTADYEWDSLIKLILTEEEIFEISIESMLDQVLYLDSLVVNSEGSVIDKGPSVSFVGMDTKVLEDTNNANRAKQNYFSSEKFKNYNSSFYKRAKTNELFKKISYSILVIGGVLLVSQFKIVAFICLLVSIIFFSFGSILSLTNDSIVDFVFNSPIKPIAE